jgi:putative aminopeptidase FrvX
MADRLGDLMTRLDAAVGVAGDERLVAEIMVEEIADHVDEHASDPLGNQFFTHRGSGDGPTVMLIAHMDELGFCVSHVEDEGFLRIAPIGGHDARMVIDQDLRVHGLQGPVDGVTGAKPAHLLTEEERKKAIPMHELFIDVGTSSREETERLGVRVGQMVTFGRDPIVLNGTRTFSGKAVDDRAGCGVLVEVMRRLRDRDVSATVCGVASVQEEVGLRGARPAAHRVQPDLGLAIDVTLCGDTPGMEFSRMPIRLGKGPAIKYYESGGWQSHPVPRAITERLEKAADRASIAYQREVLVGGGTDSWEIALTGHGALAGTVSVPSRYIHSAVGMINLDDMEGAVELILAFLEDIEGPVA